LHSSKDHDDLDPIQNKNVIDANMLDHIPSAGCCHLPVATFVNDEPVCLAVCGAPAQG
jgi:hypothetical protein